MDDAHEGGCLCGNIRYRVAGPPMRTPVCHCTFCQRRTGTAFAIEPFFETANIAFSGGQPQAYRHVSDESKRWIEIEFCPRCGTNIGFTLERWPGQYSIAGGTFDDPNWFKVDRHIWTRSMVSWMELPTNCERWDEAWSGMVLPQVEDRRINITTP